MELDEKQQMVADHEDGHMLVLAGAGSGKTSAIIQRAYQRIQSGIPANKILMMTFTNKAAREMQERLLVKLKKDPSNEHEKVSMPTITTYHCFGHRFITKNPQQCQRQSNFSIMLESDVKSLLKAFTEAVVHKDVAKGTYDIYSLIRNEGLDATRENDKSSILKMIETKGVDQNDAKNIYLAWQEYEYQKQFQNTIDFNDLINLPIHAMRNNPELRYKINDFLNDITIDEAQDNNKAQYKMLKLIAPSAGFQSVVMIGDDDQSIHRWRGANPEGLHTFQNDYFPSVYLMENNYRSQPNIVVAATSVIRNNTDRMEKNPTPILSEKPNSFIELFQRKSGDEMAEALAIQIKESIRNGEQPKDIAVLYRTNKMADFLEPFLLKHGVPYSIKKGMELLERSESKLMIAAARLAVNPRDQSAFIRVAEIIPGLGKKRIDDLFETLQQGESIFDAIERLPKKAKEEAEKAIAVIKQIYIDGPKSLITWTEQPAYIKWLEKRAEAAVKAGDEEDESIIVRVATYKRNIGSIQDTINERLRLLDRNSTTPPNLAEQWGEAFDVILRPPEDEYENNRVVLSTAHSAKGLEWNTVHIVGFSEGLMPMVPTSPDAPPPTDNQIKEERCLAYVAMTRAKRNLYFHHATRMNLNNGAGYSFYQVSRFYAESGLNKANASIKDAKRNYYPQKKLNFV